MKKILHTLILISMFFGIVACVKDNSDFKHFDSDVQIVDVRTQEEWNEGHHPDAVLIPHKIILEGKGFAELDKTKPVVLYCRSGRRAELAKTYLESQGFSDVKNLGGVTDMMIAKKDAK
jgi:phage shock protein E